MAVFKQESHDIYSVLEINRPIEVIVKAKKHKYVYRSTIGDFDSANIAITPLIRLGVHTRLHEGDEVEVIYFAATAMYQFTTKVVGHKRENNIVLTIMSVPAECWRIQRREFFRLDFSLVSSFKKVDIETRNAKKYYVTKGKPLSCALVDISGGGVSFRTTVELADATYVKLAMALPGEGPGGVLREIVHVIRVKKVRPLAEKNMFEYTYGCRFMRLSDDDRTKIIQFIMRKQIEGRKKTVPSE